MGVGGQRHAPDALPPVKTRYPLYRRPDGSQDRSGRVRKISLPSGFDLRTVKPVASRYTDWAIPAHRFLLHLLPPILFTWERNQSQFVKWTGTVHCLIRPLQSWWFFYSTPDTFQTICFFTGGFFRFLMRTLQGFFLWYETVHVSFTLRFKHFHASHDTGLYQPLSLQWLTLLGANWL